MRYILLLMLVALVVVLVLHFGVERKTNPVGEAGTSLDKAKLAALPAQLQQVEAALAAYADERGAFPAALAELVPFYLRADDLLIDPWGTRLRLEKSADGGTAIFSAGPDRAFTSSDDIRRSL